MYKLIGGITAGFFAFVLWLIYTANTGRESVFFELVESIPYGDKVGHLLLFGFLTLAANFAFRLRILDLRVFRLYIGTGIVSLFVVLEELSQTFIPSRTFELEDLAADTAGIILFTVLSHLIAKVGLVKSVGLGAARGAV